MVKKPGANPALLSMKSRTIVVTVPHTATLAADVVVSSELLVVPLTPAVTEEVAKNPLKQTEPSDLDRPHRVGEDSPLRSERTSGPNG